MTSLFGPPGARAARLAAAIVVALGLSVAGPARADALDDAFRKGTEAYLAGDAAAAVLAFEQIDRQGVLSADLAYNLGNAYFKRGELGRAIWAFERAAALEPDDGDARYNLAVARELAERRARDRIEGAEREATWIRLVTALPAGLETWMFLALYLATFALLFARRAARGAWRATLTATGAILAVAAAGSGALVGGRAALDRVPFAVMLPDATSAREGADTQYRASFELHAGLKVRLIEKDGDWVRIRLPNGLEGWVRDADVGRL